MLAYQAELKRTSELRTKESLQNIFQDVESSLSYDRCSEGQNNEGPLASPLLSCSNYLRPIPCTQALSAYCSLVEVTRHTRNRFSLTPNVEPAQSLSTCTVAEKNVKTRIH